MKVGVVGLGTMGAGIAQLAVEAGLETVGREVTDELGERARGRIEHFLSRKVAKGQIDAFDIGLLSLTTDLAAFADCDVVVEAIVEELEPKRELFAELERVCRPEAVLATNTSALSVTEIAGATSTPERVVGMHFFNPAPLMPLVEVVRAERTSDEAFETAYGLGERLGKHPIRRPHTPRLAGNPVPIPLPNDRVRLPGPARATPAVLDAGPKHRHGRPVGASSQAVVCHDNRASRNSPTFLSCAVPWERHAANPGQLHRSRGARTPGRGHRPGACGCQAGLPRRPPRGG